jgi:hypothetical protein
MITAFIYLNGMLRLTIFFFSSYSLLFIPPFALMQKVEPKDQGAQCSACAPLGAGAPA